MSIHSIYNIRNRFNAGENLDFVFFWGPGESKQDRRFLNQWQRAAFYHKHFLFANAEQAMMAEKASLFNDWGTFHQILDCVEPRAVKALGRMVQGYVDEIWASERLARVAVINYEKFSQNHEMGQYLLSTGDNILVEASPVDNVWGIKMAEDHADILDPNKWQGQNLLGQALMIVRDKLREEQV